MNNFFVKKIIGIAVIISISTLVFYWIAFCDSNIYLNEKVWSQIQPKKSSAVSELIDNLEAGVTPEWLADFAPVVWFHPDEIYKTTDPQELLQHTEIVYRELYPGLTFFSREKVNLGPFNAKALASFEYKTFKPTDVVSRIFENGSVLGGRAGFELSYDPDQTMSLPPPLFWRISKNPVFAEIQPPSSDELLLPIEFWFHYNFNKTGVWIANHDGDWESTLILLKVKFSEGRFNVSRFMVSATAHGGSRWHCDKNLGHQGQHAELYSALGTHASYVDAGYHWRGPYPDRTARGSPWETWRLMRPVVKESFYGFSGSWGASSFIHFQTAPIAPGPQFKYLPAQTNVNLALRDFKNAAAVCEEPL